MLYYIIVYYIYIILILYLYYTNWSTNIHSYYHKLKQNHNHQLASLSVIYSFLSHCTDYVFSHYSYCSYYGFFEQLMMLFLLSNYTLLIITPHSSNNILFIFIFTLSCSFYYPNHILSNTILSLSNTISSKSYSLILLC